MHDIEEALAEKVQHSRFHAKPFDIRFLLESYPVADLTRGPAGLSFRPARGLSHGDIWNLVSSLVQNAGGHDILEHFTVDVFSVALPSGQSAKANKLTHEEVVKCSILIIINTDNLCFLRSLVVAMIYSERGNVRTGELHAKWNAVRKQNSVMQRELALELTRKAGVSIPDEGCNIPEFERFQLHVAKYDAVITVYNFSSFVRGAPPL
ncbi:hypothetical protein EAI_07632 [Harpegnathos saltator]|uniref:Uncharacterized protein n=1 Tax=Harpegnathos saltator TaxID=610380 RepID=E2BDZ6_HARSA|nr:hypothetical protein EAI_07632 [Harpegnathos saltator]